LSGGGVGRILDNLKPKALAVIFELLIDPPSNESSSAGNGSGSAGNGSDTATAAPPAATATSTTTTTSATSATAAAVVAAETAPSGAASVAANLLALMEAKRRAAPFGLLEHETQVAVLAAMPLQCRRELLVRQRQ